MSFVKRNLVMIVMLPVIGGIHYAWMKMNDQSDRKELPIISMFRVLTNKATSQPPGNSTTATGGGGSASE